MARIHVLHALLCTALLTIGCSDPAESGTPTDGGAGGPADGAGPSSGACPLSLTDGTVYNAVACEVTGTKSFAAGVYQIQISARFNNNQPVRSVMFTLSDSDLATESHVKSFPVGTANPGVNASYQVALSDKWGTLENTNVVGSGSFVVTEYDRTSKLISGTFDIVTKQGATSKTITGTLTRVPMTKAE